jgi:hypothetical protein
MSCRLWILRFPSIPATHKCSARHKADGLHTMFLLINPVMFILVAIERVVSAGIVTVPQRWTASTNAGPSSPPLAVTVHDTPSAFREAPKPCTRGKRITLNAVKNRCMLLRKASPVSGWQLRWTNKLRWCAIRKDVALNALCYAHSGPTRTAKQSLVSAARPGQMSKCPMFSCWYVTVPTLR